jgi:hypothetical protein
MAAFQNEIDKIMVPISAVQTKLAEVRQILDPKREQLRALAAEKEHLALEFAKRDSDVSKQIADGTDKAESAWAEVGQCIVVEKFNEPRLQEMKKRAIEAIKTAGEAAQEAALLERCQDDYDHDVVRYAQKTAIIAAIALTALIFVLAFVS